MVPLGRSGHGRGGVGGREGGGGVGQGGVQVDHGVLARLNCVLALNAI